MKNLYITLTLILASVTAFAQNGTIKGKINSADGQPAAFVTVGLKDTKKGALTNEEGQFILKNVKQGNYELVISYTGTKTIHKSVTVTADQTTDVTFALEATAAQLNEIVVEGTRTRTINRSPVNIGKLPVAAIDLPQGVAVIGHEVLEDQQVQRMSDVVKNINGVYMASSRAGTQESFNARGYGFSSTNMFKNGARVNSGVMPEMSSLEKVEILKGSAAILYGNVAPGAVMNMVTKQPKFTFGGEVNVRGGSFGLLKPAFDVYGPLSSKVAYRINGTFETTDSYRDKVHSKRYYVNPSLLFKLSERTELLVQGDYLKHDFTPDFGIGSLDNTKIAPVSRNSFFGTPWQYAHTQQSSAGATIRHKLNDNWTLNGTFSYQRYSRDYYSIERVQADANGKWARPLNRAFNSEDYYLAQADLNGKFNTGRLEHNVLVGVDGDRYYTKAYSYNQPTTYDTINILNPDLYTPRTDIPEAARIKDVTTPINRVGVYAQDVVKITAKLNFLAGIRFSYLQNEAPATYDYKSGQTTFTTAKYDHAFSPRLGLVYKPVETMAVFASYSNSFTPNNGLDVDSNSLNPSVIDQYEVGVKNDFFKGRLSVNVTAYRIKNNNYAQTAPFQKDGVTPNNNANLKALIGETLSRGVEVDIAGHPLPGLDVIAGYSYNNITIQSTSGVSGGAVEGERLVGNPNHTANASVFYTLQKSALKGLKFGAGYYYIGQRFGGWNNTINQSQKYNRLISVPGFSTLDLSAGYSFKRFSVMAKVSNITNTYNYYVHENYSVNPIPPTQFVGTVSYRF
ncbi:TonB-dependent receptor [Chitinophaga sp. S165]|uniref:TonB-dependent receptor n=1 Tax=Chitinophaga sp. S165 TaxID=2135462 RepID=UPI000D70AB43|nr:TonB-dependent receptor [Chitinophaga sp. S165]PWV51612.1 iron complex outermembrane receptor protein [Chitinophaga sp. S165]